MGEGGLGAQPLGVVAGGDQELASGVDPDPGQGDQRGRDRGDQQLELDVEPVELGLELLPATDQAPQAGLGGRQWASQGPGRSAAHTDKGLGLEPQQGLAQLFGAL